MGVGPVGFIIEQQDQLWEMWRGRESIRAMVRALGVDAADPAVPASVGR